MEFDKVIELIDKFGYPVAVSIYLIWDNHQTKKMFMEKFDTYAAKFDTMLDKFDVIKEVIAGLHNTMNSQFLVLARSPVNSSTAMAELLIRNSAGGGN